MVGVSGGIGSGKSTVADAFSRLGAAIVDTDRIAHDLTGPAGAAISAIHGGFGDGVIGLDGGLDRAAMRRRVFSDTVERGRLEAILHPLILDESHRLCSEARQDYVLLVIPLLAETRGRLNFSLDRVLVVDCDPATQVARVMARNGLSECEVKKIIAAQADRATRLALADDVLSNESSTISLEREVSRLHEFYLSLAAVKLKALC